MKKSIIIGLVVGFVMLLITIILGQFANFLFPSLTLEYSTSIYRPWTDPRMMLYFVHPFIVGMLLCWVWTKVQNIIKEQDRIKKGLLFGLLYWVFFLPGMLITYSSFTVSFLMVATWSVTGLLQALAAGLVLAKLNK